MSAIGRAGPGYFAFFNRRAIFVIFYLKELFGLLASCPSTTQSQDFSLGTGGKLML
jgi:hypothetical protein